MKHALIVLSAVLLERLFGELRRWQWPLTRFAWLARQAEAYCYGPDRLPAWLRLALGGLVLAVLLVPCAVAAGLLADIPYVGDAAALGLLTLALQTTAIRSQARTIIQALREHDLTQAQQRLKDWVDHDTARLDEEGVSAAVIEKLLEQSHDALFGVVFWFLVAGAPGAVIYRLTMILAAHWGYATPRYRHFGWSVARLAAVLRGLPACLTALGYGLAGDRDTAWRCWRRQALTWHSPTAGTLLAAGAGGLRLQLGSPIRYYDHLVHRPALGEGVLPRHHDIARALRLIDRAQWLWAGVLVCGAWWLS
jgi:adenosylcobinamide-phosphate synthase